MNIENATVILLIAAGAIAVIPTLILFGMCIVREVKKKRKACAETNLSDKKS